MGAIRDAAAQTRSAAYADSLQNTPRRADDRRKAENSESRTAAFGDGYFAQSEAKLAASADVNVSQGRARAQERSWANQ